MQLTKKYFLYLNLMLFMAGNIVLIFISWMVLIQNNKNITLSGRLSMHATSLAPAPISDETRDESEENKKVL